MFINYVSNTFSGWWLKSSLKCAFSRRIFLFLWDSLESHKLWGLQTARVARDLEDFCTKSRSGPYLRFLILYVYTEHIFGGTNPIRQWLSHAACE